MAIGGGGGKRYVVYAMMAEDSFFNLARSETTEGSMPLVVGGQEGDYSAAQVVSLEDAREAGRVFMETGGLNPSQRWIHG